MPANVYVYIYICLYVCIYVPTKPKNKMYTYRHIYVQRAIDIDRDVLKKHAYIDEYKYTHAYL